MVENYILYGIVMLLAILYLVDKHRSEKRISELLNRLMARDFNAYVQGVKALKKKPEKVKPVTLSDLMEKDKDILPVD